ncbi:hypothetical protein GQ600_4392 [Phytophthora cactorum]|nr:hypothetical protein GQ600_4392 [Phytophthora cactorum]
MMFGHFAFPVCYAKKFGLSKQVMETVHEGMTSPHGLSSTVENIHVDERQGTTSFFASLPIV